MYNRVKTPKELEALRESARINATVIGSLLKQIQPGMTGLDINRMAAEETKAMGAKTILKGYQGFPAVICISKNEEIVHGIPNGGVLEKGDLLSLDYCVSYKGMISDMAKTIIVGDDNSGGKQQAVSDELALKRKLLAGTEEALMAAIKVVKGDVRIGDIGAAAQEVMERYGLGIIRDLVGHGVGHDVHEEPNIPNYGKKGTGGQLKTGMTVAIEPMATLGTHNIELDKHDGWTIRTADGSLSAHFEHTLLVTDGGCEILTLI